MCRWQSRFINIASVFFWLARGQEFATRNPKRISTWTLWDRSVGTAWTALETRSKRCALIHQKFKVWYSCCSVDARLRDRYKCWDSENLYKICCGIYRDTNTSFFAIQEPRFDFVSRSGRIIEVVQNPVSISHDHFRKTMVSVMYPGGYLLARWLDDCAPKPYSGDKRVKALELGALAGVPSLVLHYVWGANVTATDKDEGGLRILRWHARRNQRLNPGASPDGHFFARSLDFTSQQDRDGVEGQFDIVVMSSAGSHPELLPTALVALRRCGVAVVVEKQRFMNVTIRKGALGLGRLVHWVRGLPLDKHGYVYALEVWLREGTDTGMCSDYLWPHWGSGAKHCPKAFRNAGPEAQTP